jgi:indole-3-glycerol phosphate synthase
MDWQALRPAKDAELERLAHLPLSEVSPSIRTFAQYVTTHRQELAFIAALKRTDPDTGRGWPQTDLVALARACDEAEVGAVGVYTEPSVLAPRSKTCRRSRRRSVHRSCGSTWSSIRVRFITPGCVERTRLSCGPEDWSPTL